MKIEWLPHAKERLRERGISESLVRQIVRAPQQVIGHGPYRIFQSRMMEATRQKEYLVRVFAEVHRNRVVIQSAYRTSKIYKYWRSE